MTSISKLHRPVLSGVLMIGSLVSALSLASTPAQAQIDSGIVPVVGAWNREAHDTVAWVDLTHWKLVTSATGSPFTVRFDPDPNPWFPVAGDWDGDGVDTVQMFHRATWRVVPLENGPVEVTADPSPTPWVPVAGDWEGGGIDTLATRRPERSAEASSVWAMLSGDWDGDGIDTDAALHLPTGRLVHPGAEETALRSTAGEASTPTGQDAGLAAIFAPSAGGGPGSCYIKITDWSQWVKVFHYRGAAAWRSSPPSGRSGPAARFPRTAGNTPAAATSGSARRLTGLRVAEDDHLLTGDHEPEAAFPGCLRLFQSPAPVALPADVH